MSCVFNKARVSEQYDCFLYTLFFFKQKTAYEMLLCDWSSDVCSSDLRLRAAIADEIAVVPDRKHVAHEALRSADAARRVEREVTVLVFGVHRAVVAPAARPNIAEHKRDELAVPRGRAERQRIHHHAASGVDNAVDHPVGQDSLVVQGGAPRLGPRVALGVEPAGARASHT